MKKVLIGLGALVFTSLAIIITLCLCSEDIEEECDYEGDYV